MPFLRPGEHVEDLVLLHDWLHHLVEDLDGLVVDVELRRRPAQVRRVQVPRPLVEPDHLVLVQFSVEENAIELYTICYIQLKGED